MMLEEIEMSPGEVLEVMGLAGLAAAGARIAGAPVRADLQMELVRNLLGVEPLVQEFPRLGQPKA